MLGRVLGPRDRLVIGHCRLGGAAQAPEQVGADCVEQVVVRESELIDDTSAAAGPSTSARATAGLRATTGLGASASSWL
jgi:hypothetical protein